MYMIPWSYPDTLNAVCRLARHMTVPREAHIWALMTLIRYMISTENRGLVLLRIYGVSSTILTSMVNQTWIMQQILMMIGISLVEEKSSKTYLYHLEVPIRNLLLYQKQNPKSWPESWMQRICCTFTVCWSCYRDQCWTIHDAQNGQQRDCSWSVDGRHRHVVVTKFFLHELKD